MQRSYIVEYDFKSKPDSLTIVEKSNEAENVAHFRTLMGIFAYKIEQRDDKSAGLLSSLSSLFSPAQEHYVTLDLNDGLQFKQTREFVNEMNDWIDKADSDQYADMKGMLSNPDFHIGHDGNEFVVTLMEPNKWGHLQDWNGAKREGDQFKMNDDQMQSFMQEMVGKPIYKTDAAQQALQADGPKP
jgi:hypothetical protein